MPSVAASIRRSLRAAGVSPQAISAAWPQWWTPEAERSPSAITELRFTLARRLGISPSSLIQGSPRFVLGESAKFKNLGTESQQDRVLLTSFGSAVARITVSATVAPDVTPPATAIELREAILASGDLVQLRSLLVYCWAVGIPVVSLAVFPLTSKRMHAMTVRIGSRYAILIGTSSQYPSQIAFTLAHELGHLILGHVPDHAGLIEMQDPLRAEEPDDEEAEADRFALTLLTGEPVPVVQSTIAKFNAAQLANAATETAQARQIEPGLIALILAYSTGNWSTTYSAVRLLQGGQAIDTRSLINELAQQQLNWDAISGDSGEYLLTVLGAASDAR